MSRDPHEFESYYDEHQDDFLIYDDLINEEELIENYGIEFVVELYGIDEEDLEEF